MLLTLYDRYHKRKADLSPNDSSRQDKEVQSDNILTLSFTLYEYVVIDVNDYVDFQGERYWAVERYRPDEVNSRQWVYDLKLYGIESLIKRFLVLNMIDGDADPVFTLTAPPVEHVRLIVGVINSETGSTDWKTGTVEGMENVTIDYEGKYCHEALEELAKTVGTEYWIEGTTVNLCRCEHGEEIEMGYGDGLTGISVDKADNAVFYTILFPVGSSRNIDPERYGHPRLQLPGGQRYVDVNVEQYGIIHHFEKDAFADIYPRRIGTVSSVRKETRVGDDGNPFDIYYFKDSALGFDPGNYMLAGKILRVSFQEGSELAGLGSEENGTYYFEVNYDGGTEEFEIITVWPYDDDQQLPGDRLIPAEGDKYILWNLRMPDEYYPLAEQEFLNAVREYNQQHVLDIAKFTGQTDHVWIEERNVVLTVGQRVRLKNSQYFQEGYKSTRITRICRNVSLPSLMDIELCDALSTGTKDKFNNDITDVRNYVRSIGQSVPDIIKTGDGTLPTDNNLFSARRSIQEFLSAKEDDTAQGFIRFIQGMQVGSLFTPGILGEGGVFRRDGDGKTYIEADKLYIRMKAYFDNVEIRDYQHTSGNRIASQARGFTASRVEWLDADGNILEQTAGNLTEAVRFRVYWRARDDEHEAENQFVIGDQAFSDYTDIADGSLVSRRYWRVVVGRNGSLTDDGEAWIDISNRTTETITYTDHAGVTRTKTVQGCEDGSDTPQAEDDVCQLGNVWDTERQGAVIEYVGGEDAPSYQIFQGIDSFSLNGRNYIGLGYSSKTGRAYMNVYGDTYIGDKPDAQGNAGSYIKYDSVKKELEIKARVEMTSSSQVGGTSIEEYIKNVAKEGDWTKDEINSLIAAGITGKADTTDVEKAIEDIQKQVDGAIETFYYEGEPTLSNAPVSSWKKEDYATHIGDLYYDKKTGYAYRFMLDGDTYKWTPIQDEDIAKALGEAQDAYNLAGGKRRIFVTQPTPPYDEGDMWVNATYPADGSTYKNDILRCKKAKAEGKSFAIGDWQLASKYTDDSQFNGYISQILNGSGATGDAATVANAIRVIKGALGEATVIDGGLVLTSLINMRSGSKTWAGISGMYQESEKGDGYKGHGIAAWYGGPMVDHEVSTEASDYANTLFRFDGSGYLAGGAVSWTAKDASGVSKVTIRNLYTMISGEQSFTDNVLNKATLFSNLFWTSTEGTTVGSETRILPQAAFRYINVEHTAEDTITDTSVLNRGENDARYLSIEFFNSLFQLYNGSTKITPNGTLPTDKSKLNIKAMFGFWTEYYLSAMGLGDGTGTGASSLSELLDVSLSSPSGGQALVYDSTRKRWVNGSVVTDLTGYATQEWAAGQYVTSLGSSGNYLTWTRNGSTSNITVPYATKAGTLNTARTISLTGDVTGSVSFNGGKDVSLATSIGEAAVTNDMLAGSIANSKLANSSLTVNGTAVSLGGSVTTKTWGTARNISVADSDKTNTGTAVSVNGSAAVTLLLPATIKAALKGNADTATKLTSDAGSGTQPIYFSGGVPVVTKYALSATLNSSTAGYLAYYSGANAVGGGSYLRYLSETNAVSHAVAGLEIIATGYGNAADLLSGTNGVIGYGDAGPQIRFTPSTTQHLALIATHYDNAGGGASLHLVSDQARVVFATQEIVARTRLSIGVNKPDDTYELSVNGSAYTSRLYLAAGVYLEYDSSNKGIRVVGAGLYSDTYISALGAGSATGGGSGSMDTDMLWSVLQDNYASYKDKTVDYRYLSQLRTLSWSYGSTASAAASSYNGQAVASLVIPSDTAHLTNGAGYITSYTDTKNTAGTTSKTATKMYLVAAASQAANPVTYSNGSCYIGTDNCLYSDGKKVLTAHQPLSDYVTLATAQTVSGKKTFSAQQAFTVATGTSPFTVSSTTAVANLNADMLDGKHKNSFLDIGGTSGVTSIASGSDLNDILTAGTYYSQSASVSATLANTPHTGGNFRLWHIVNTGTGGTTAQYSQQIIIGGTSVYLRYVSGNPVTYGAWKKFAFETSNVASATKLQTARTLWGQPFDGTSDVSGDMTGVGSISAGGSMTITNNADSIGYRLKGSLYELALFIGAGHVNRGIYDWTIAKWLLYFNKDNTILNYGNVGIGTTSPSYKLHVAGTMYASGNSGIDGTLGVTGATTLSSTLGVTGATTLGSTLGVTGAATLSSTLSVASTSTFKNIMTLYRESDTDTNSPAGLCFSVKDTTTGKTYSTAYIYGYSDHNASAANGLNMVIRSGGNMFIGGGEAPSNHYALYKSSTTEHCYVTADGIVYIQGNGNTIANRKGFYVSTAGNLIPCAADTATSGAVSLGSTTYRFNNVCGVTADISGDVTAGGNLTAGGHVYLGNNRKIYFDNPSGTACPQVTVDTANNLILGENQVASGSNTYVRGYVAYVQAGASHANVLMCRSDYIRALVGFYSDSYVSALGQNTSSDIRRKDIKENILLGIDDIAAAPMIRYEWRDRRELGLQAGSVAQYWERVLPESVRSGADGYLTMQYGVIALLSAVSVARRVRDHERRIASLEREARILREEISRLRNE